MHSLFLLRFAAACTGGGRPSVARVTTAARRLADKRHYAEAQITGLAHRLERAYKQLSAGKTGFFLMKTLNWSKIVSINF